MRTRSRRAFTLHELLTVTAVIAILGAILHPVFARAREAARQTSCASNVKQISVALLLYSEDYDQITIRDRFTRPDGTHYSWVWALQPYIRKPVWTCPSDRNPADAWDGSDSDPAVSYGYNYLFLNGVPLATVQKPDATVGVLDSGGYDASGDPQLQGSIVNPVGAALPSALAAAGYTSTHSQYRHSEYANVGYLDGHVKAHKAGLVEQKSLDESGVNLQGNEVFVLWNLY
jgi:prepilin-type processing-associated H-X9-DG protein/prepilin-type N-terminal cleavage/methylation domain-containing protein